VEIAVAVASGIHEHKPDWLFWLVCLDGMAQSASGIGYKQAWVAVNAFKTHVVPQT
jgi:hypothetical protein